MSSVLELRVPREIVNDDFVTLVGWNFQTGAFVRVRDVVAQVETSKSLLDIEADVDGYLEIISPVDSQVAVGAVIGRVHPQPIHVAENSRTATEASTAHLGNGEGAAALNVSRKAQEMMQQHQISPEVFAGRGLVREADVLAYVRQLEAAVVSPPAPEIRAAEPVRTSAPSSAVREARRGLLFDARQSARARGSNIFALAWNYFWRNWLLGNLVRWAPRGVILPLHRWRGVRIGRDCFVDPTAILETAYPENITIEDDVRITAGAIIMTHIKAPHFFRETGIMPPVLKPVVLEEHCFIGVGAIVLPGVTVGRAAVVASGAVVVSNVPPFTMVGGNPAKVIRKFRLPEPRKD